MSHRDMDGTDEPTEAEMIGMLMEDETNDTSLDVRLKAKPAPAATIKVLSKSITLNEWLVVERGGRRFRGGRLVALNGGA